MNHSASAAIDTASGCAAERTTRSSPSPPSPARRSHSRATRAGGRSSRPSGSGTITKSFSVRGPLRNRRPFGISLPAPSYGERAGAGGGVGRGGGSPAVVGAPPHAEGQHQHGEGGVAEQ